MAIYMRRELSPYPLSTYSLNKTVSITNLMSSISGFYITPNQDNIFFTQASSTSYVYKYAISTPGDISTIGNQINAISVGNYYRPQGLYLSDDGYHLYYADKYSSNYGLRHWVLPSPYDISTHTVATGVSLPYQAMYVFVGNQGYNSFVGNGTATTRKYTYSTAYGEVSASADITSPSTNIYGLYITDNGLKRYANVNGTIKVFEANTAWDAPSSTALETLSVSGTRQFQFSSDFEKFWVTDGVNIYEYKHS